MKHRILVLGLVVLALAGLCSCGGSATYGGGSGGALSVQMTQGPPQFMKAGGTAGLVATVLHDKNDAGVNWSCSPASACGSFSPAKTTFEIGTLYTAPTTGPRNAVVVPVTVTATSIADNSQSASAIVNVYVATPAVLTGQYAFVLEGYASFGLVGSVTLDGSGNITGGEGDGSANGFYTTVPSITGNYTLDSTGHGSITFSLNNTSCCGTFTETHSLTVTSSSHALIAEIDQFNGLTIGGIGSLDLQSAGPSFSASQVSGGYSFTLTGFSGAKGANGSWAGIFTADGVSSISNGVYDENVTGATGYSSVPFTGTFTAPDANGRGTLTVSATPDTAGSTVYAYYIVTPKVLRLTSVTNAGNSGNTGSAFGQGSVGTTTAALKGSYVFSDLGFDHPGNAMGAAGQFTADGSGNITAGVMDLNDSGNAGSVITSLPVSGVYSISGSPRGTITGPSGQTYNIYLTDPTLNLLDPNNASGTGGALLLETDATFGAIGLAIPQANPSTATLQGPYAMLLSDQNGPPNSDGGFTGSFSAPSATGPNTFSGEGEFQTRQTVVPVTGPLSGTFIPDTSNPGRFAGTITTMPAFPNDAPPGPSGPVSGLQKVSFYLANSSQGFIVETDTVAPVTGAVEVQDPPPANAARAAVRTHVIKQQTKAIKRVAGPKGGSTQVR